MKSTVLLIDDDVLDLRSLQQLLTSWGLEVLPVRSGREALARLAERAVDMVVSDVRMPGMSGQDVVSAVGEAYPQLPVLLITAHADVRSAVDAMKLGAFDYVVKPPDEDEFRLTIERALEHGRLRRENTVMRAQLAAGGAYGERLMGRSPLMQEMADLINRVAPTDSTVLITGETGTGKELVAQALHYKSRRSAQPLIALNCAALNANLIESELFGHERGAFTGAVAARRGRFEEADGGTLFLDEISETEPEFQAKLLRVLQEGEFERLGGNAKIKVDVRLIASTNRDLQAAVAEGSFREDLYYRLSVIPVRVPPLRERPGDIERLASHFLDRYRDRYACPAREISVEGMRALTEKAWPGNVRELQHAIERAVVLSSGEVLGAEAFTVDPVPLVRGGDTLNTVLEARTREHLLSVLDKAGWRKGRAAGMLGIDRATLYRLIKKHSLSG